MRKPIQLQLPKSTGAFPGVQPPIPIREWRGVNTFDPLSIGDNFFTDMSNFCTDDYPAVSVRPGYTVLGSAVGTKVLGLGVWEGSELHAVFDDGTWRKWTGSAWSSALVSGLDTSAMWSFTSFQGNFDEVNLIGANGVDGLHRYDGSTVQTFGDAPSEINYVTTYQNRVWGAFGAEIRACKLDDATSWESFPGTDEDSYGKTIESSRGEAINLLSGELTKLTIGFPNSRRELYGSLPSDFYDRLVSDSSGFANNNSAVTLNGRMRSLHTTGLYEYVSGGLGPDKAFAEVVEGYAGSIGVDAAAGTDGKKIYLSTEPGQILVHDPRSGVEAWSVWHDIDATCFVQFQNDTYIGDASGRVLKLGGQDDAGTAISGYLISKPFTSPSIAQRQRWLKMWTVWELATGTTLTVSLSKTVDGNDWTQVASITSSGFGSQRIMIPVGEFVLENTVRVRFDIEGWGRMHEYTRQVRLLPMR